MEHLNQPLTEKLSEYLYSQPSFDPGQSFLAGTVNTRVVNKDIVSKNFLASSSNVSFVKNIQIPLKITNNASGVIQIVSKMF